jgi:hypothetical protein
MLTAKITRAALAARLGLGSGDTPSYTGVAAMIREALARWGVETRRLVQSYVRRQCDSAGFEREVSAQVLKKTLEHLIFLGEIAETSSMGQLLLASVEPHWVDIGGGCAIALGTLPTLPDGLQPWDAATDDGSLAATLRHCRLDDQARATLLTAGIVERKLDHVTALPSQLAALRLDLDLDSKATSLRDIWICMERRLSTDGLQRGEHTPLRLLSGAPGTFFGRHDTPSGRWSEAAPDGAWLGVIENERRGNTPCLVLVRDGEATRTLSVRSWELWRWLLLARAEHTKEPEVIKRSGQLLQPTFLLPSALLRRLTLLNIAPNSTPYHFEILADEPIPDGFGVIVT